MREIKFRAWFGEEHKMIPFDELHIELENGEYTVWYSLDGDSIQDGLCVEDFNIMQYTGLKDKNGKEIYEGDILLTKDIEGEKYQTCVTYENGMFLSGEEPLYDDVFLFEAEVVGNIYENPELLEVLNEIRRQEIIKGLEDLKDHCEEMCGEKGDQWWKDVQILNEAICLIGKI